MSRKLNISYCDPGMWLGLTAENRETSITVALSSDFSLSFLVLLSFIIILLFLRLVYAINPILSDKLSTTPLYLFSNGHRCSVSHKQHSASITSSKTRGPTDRALVSNWLRVTRLLSELHEDI
jgi:hypothetical protein